MNSRWEKGDLAATLPKQKILGVIAKSEFIMDQKCDLKKNKNKKCDLKKRKANDMKLYYYIIIPTKFQGFPSGSAVKNPPAMQEMQI